MLQRFLPTPEVADESKQSQSGDDQYEVEDIVGHVKRDGRYRYIVRWKDYSSEHDEERPASALRGAPDVFAAYKERNGILSDNVAKDRRLRAAQEKKRRQAAQSP